MKNLSRDTKLAIGILLVLFLITGLAAAQQRREQQHPTLSTLSSAPDGALALKLWVKELQYKVDERVLDKFHPAEGCLHSFHAGAILPNRKRIAAPG